jgi:hypothetical protein
LSAAAHGDYGEPHRHCTLDLGSKAELINVAAGDFEGEESASTISRRSRVTVIDGPSAAGTP